VSRVIDVRQEPGGVLILLRPYAFWRSITIPIAQLATLLVVFAIKEPHSQQDRILTVLIALGAGLVLGSLAFSVAYLLLGREESVAVSGTQLIIDRQVLRRPELRKRRAYAISRIVNVRAVGPAKPPQAWGACLAFDYDGSPVNFGLGVAGPEADRVLRALAAAVPAWTAPESERRSAAVAFRSRGWSRVTLLIAALSIACLVQVVLAWPLDPTKLTLALAIAILSSAFIPMWAFNILNLESPVIWRSRIWVRLVAVLCYIGAALFVPMAVMFWVTDELLTPLRPLGKNDLFAIWIVNLLLGMAGFFWAVYRADKRGWPMREERGISRISSQ
jgi:hypothetical protein